LADGLIVWVLYAWTVTFKQDENLIFNVDKQKGCQQLSNVLLLFEIC